MKETVRGSLFIIELNQLDSSFISQICYDARTDMLSVVMKNDNVYNYEKVPMQTFVEFSVARSYGEFYNSNIKNKFKHKIMAKENGKQQPNRINKASANKRFIRMSIDLTKVNKAWLYKGDSGALYLKITLMMLPDGEVDKYGRLGMVVQDVPPEVAKAEKGIRGEILGNGEELEWSREEEKTELVSKEDDNIMDDLPF